MSRAHALLIAGLAAWFSGLAPVHAAEVRMYLGGGGFSVPVKSSAETRWAGVVRQQYDYSCGSAAVATLLTHHYEMPISEREVFTAMFNQGDQAKIQTEGFSMLDMKRFLDAKGLQSDGFRLDLDRLVKLGVPVIALVDTKGYKHFVVIKGVKDGQVLVGDPAAGTTVVAREAFEGIWNGIVLGARARVATARQYFNHPRDWRVRPRARLAAGIDRTGLGMFTLTLPAGNEFGR